MQYFDLARQGLRAMAKRWQGGKGAGKGLKLMVLGPWWNVLRAGFETLSKCSIATWQGKGKGRWQSDGKGLKLMVLGWGPGGTCFAQVLKSSKCRISTWQGRGKGRKVHRRVSCPSEICLVQVWKPSKCNIRSGKALAKG